MAAGKIQSLQRFGSLMRSKSEGTLIDLDDSFLTNNNRNGFCDSLTRRNSDWPILQPEVLGSTPTNNPFWNKSASNPFLDDIVHNSSDILRDTSTLNADNEKSLDTNNDDVLSSSSEEDGNLGEVFCDRRKSLHRSGKWRSASDILHDLERKTSKREKITKPPGVVLNPDFEWLKNDREAYKMAWLSHRQLTRSCLDLGVISQSPGWAQTQATDFQVISKIGHKGGSVRLPDSRIVIQIPEGHVPPGEFQEVTLKATLDSPPGLNNNDRTTLSPLVEVALSSVNTKTSVSLDIKLSGEVKSDPISQMMTSVVGLICYRREGPYEKVKHCSTERSVMHMELQDLKTHFYVIAVAEAVVLEPPATSVWDYLNRNMTIGVYGPRYIHPSFKVVIVVCCHDDVPLKLPSSDIQRGNKNLPPVVLQLWGHHQLKANVQTDMDIAITIKDSQFKVKSEDKLKGVRHNQLKLGKILHLPVALSQSNHGKMVPFRLDLEVMESNATTVIANFQVPSPGAAPIRTESRISRHVNKAVDRSRSTPIPEESVVDSYKCQNRSVDIRWYGVAIKTVLRQPRVDYLLEYFKGDTIALLSRDTVRSVGNSKVKEWYIGFLRGRTGLVHSKNLKLITRDQVIDFTGIDLNSEVLLDNMALPFSKLTYMYSAIQTLVTEHITSWTVFAATLGYSDLPRDAIIWRHAETEPDKVACVLEKLKEDCHAERSRKKFLHELLVGLLKMDAMNIVAELIQKTVILSTAVELGNRWRDLAEKMGKLTSRQIAAYEAPHKGKNGEINPQSMWKPAFDFLHSWSMRYGNNYRGMIQDLHLLLDKMKNPATRQWRQLTGALITVNCLDVFRAAAFPKS